jgi:hypothetical protein
MQFFIYDFRLGLFWLTAEGRVLNAHGSTADFLVVDCSPTIPHADRSSLTGPRTQVSGHEFTHAARTLTHGGFSPCSTFHSHHEMTIILIGLKLFFQEVIYVAQKINSNSQPEHGKSSRTFPMITEPLHEPEEANGRIANS